MTKRDIERLATTARPWLTDAGLETSLIFHDGLDLPHFASFQALESDEGLAAATRYFERYIALARQSGTGFVLDTMTWRSGAFWGHVLGRSEAGMEDATRAATTYALDLKRRHRSEDLPILVNGVAGPAGDGYSPDRLWSAERAEENHAKQIRWMAEEGADVISAITMTHVCEAIGIARAAQRQGLPVIVSFTTETDGRLPTGQALGEAIAETDEATGNAPLFYMVNCAHPDHFSDRLEGSWTARIGGVRANASRMSHAELDEAEELDDGNPEEFGMLYGELAGILPNLKVLGGCCGSDDRHVGCAARHVVHRHVAA